VEQLAGEIRRENLSVRQVDFTLFLIPFSKNPTTGKPPRHTKTESQLFPKKRGVKLARTLKNSAENY